MYFSMMKALATRKGAQVAQSAEHVLGKDEVGGSIPLLGFPRAERVHHAGVKSGWVPNGRNVPS